MMCWNWIDSSRKREALTISCPRTRHTVPSAVHGRAWTKNRENNPMQSRVDPGSQHSCCASGQEKKGPNLISSRSIRRPPTHRTDGSPNGGFTDLDVTGDEHAPEAPELQVFVWRPGCRPRREMLSELQDFRKGPRDLRRVSRPANGLATRMQRTSSGYRPGHFQRVPRVSSANPPSAATCP